MEFPQHHSEDALDKAVPYIEDAMLMQLGTILKHTYMPGKYGVALRHRFEQKGIVDDINKSVSVLEGRSVVDS